MKGNYKKWLDRIKSKQDKLQDTTGKIGVGKPDASATEKLDVNGNIKSNSYKFTLQPTITPQPNMLIAKTDGSGLLWYDSNSVLRNIGENFFSADLSNTTARNHTMNAGVTVNTLGNPHTLSGLPNKNTDIANFRKVRVQNASGLDAVVDSKSMLLDMPSYLTEQERTAWKTAMNGGWTTNTMSVSTIVPFLIPFGQDVNTTVFITGANLNLPPTTFTVEILDINNNVVATVPNNQVNLVNSGNLNFYFNFKNLPIAEYKIRLWNGVAYYTSVPKFKLVDVSNITNIDFGLAGWDVLKQATDTTTQVYGNSLTIAEVGTAGSLVTSLLSGKFAEANEDFVIELVIQASNKNTQYVGSFFKIGLTDGNTANSLVSNQFLFYGLGKTVYSQVLLRYLNSGSSVNFSRGSSTSSYTLKLTIIKQDNQLILIDPLGNGSFTTLLNSSGYKLSVQMIATGNSESFGVNIISAYKLL